MDPLFHEIFNDYTNKKDCKTECNPDEADFSRWYISSKDSNHLILSYYCRTKAVRGYEHLKVDKSSKKVLDFQSSLKGYDIMGAGEYETQVSEDVGKGLETDLLNATKDQIAEQKRDQAGNPEFCPDPGTQTFYDIQTKVENGLYYTRIAISCNVTGNAGSYSHMTHIEVVVDKDFKALNGGEPVLAAMDIPSRNSEFIREKEEEEANSAKQTDAVHRIAPGFVSILPVMWMASVKLLA